MCGHPGENATADKWPPKTSSSFCVPTAQRTEIRWLDRNPRKRLRFRNYQATGYAVGPGGRCHTPGLISTNGGTSVCDHPNAASAAVANSRIFSHAGRFNTALLKHSQSAFCNEPIAEATSSSDSRCASCSSGSFCSTTWFTTSKSVTISQTTQPPGPFARICDSAGSARTASACRSMVRDDACSSTPTPPV